MGYCAAISYFYYHTLGSLNFFIPHKMSISMEGSRSFFLFKNLPTVSKNDTFGRILVQFCPFLVQICPFLVQICPFLVQICPILLIFSPNLPIFSPKSNASKLVIFGHCSLEIHFNHVPRAMRQCRRPSFSRLSGWINIS